MYKKIKNYFSVLPLNFNSVEYLENFFVAGVASVIIIRFILNISGYPQIGGSKLHIAHLLFGGAFMLLAIFILLIFLTNSPKAVGCIIGGIGFGLFIDELGKFITQDNDYFFQPAVAIIYVVFVLIFLFIRLVEKHILVDRRDFLANAVEIIENAIINGIDELNKRKAKLYLSKSNQDPEVVGYLMKILEHLEDKGRSEKSFLSKIKDKLQNYYNKIIQHSKFAKILVAFFIIIVFANVLDVLLNMKFIYSFWNIGLIVSLIISSILILIGVYYIYQKNILRAYEYFRYSTLCSILLTQFFMFYVEQFMAIFGLIFYITILVALQYLISQQRMNSQN